TIILRRPGRTSRVSMHLNLYTSAGDPDADLLRVPGVAQWVQQQHASHSDCRGGIAGKVDEMKTSNL
ncbi:MAG: hypothetical protein M1305_05370, partial [Candidatus Marsarchaeota archaeon]|nr:hypothetical protein [Candidatus Marsarchaeota archaeon]